MFRDKAAMSEREAASRFQEARIICLVNSIGRVSHELRGCLSPALLAAERLSVSPEPSVRRVGEITSKAVERATEAIRTTLELARDGTPPPLRERASLRDLLGDPALVLGAGDIVLREIDAAQVAEAFQALVADARDRGATTIQLTADAELAVVLADNGTPPPAEPFRPLSGTGAQGYRRATARVLIRAQGGDITWDASGFHVSFPLARREQL